MSRAQPKSSPTDEHARRSAQAIAKGRPPPFNAALDRYCKSSPREIFAAFAGAARHMPPAGKDEPLAIGYLFLLQGLLEHLRYRTDQGYADAAKLIADFQANVVAQVEAGNVDGRMLAFVGGALHQSKIPASPEFAAASVKQLVDRNEDGPLPTDVHAALAGILEACDGDPFLAVGSLIESGHSMPAEARGALAGALALASGPESRGAAVLFLLDPNSAVRRALAVSRSYLDRTGAHQLALSIEKQEAPPFGLLQVAETIGGADWQPAHMAFGETLAGLIAEVPKAMCEPAALASVLRKSNELAELEAVAQSWFEDGPQIAQAVDLARGRDRP